MWLLVYAVQLIIDETNIDKKDELPQTVAEISLTFQEICQGVEKFLEITEALHSYVHKFRAGALQIVKKCMKKWCLSDFDPFKTHPEQKVMKSRPKRHIGRGLDEDDDEVLLQVECATMTVMIRTPMSSWTVFSTVRPMEKVIIYNKFLRSTFLMVETIAEDLASISQKLSSVDLEEGLRAASSDLVAIIIQFTKTFSPNEQNMSPENYSKCKKTLKDFWEAVDQLHDEVHSLLVLAQETRDICRTCYVHLDQFYKWNLPSYDIFLSQGQRKRNSRQSTQFGMKELWGKFTNQEQKNTTSLHFLSLMDFHSSIYQTVLAKHTIECDKMYMKVV